LGRFHISRNPGDYYLIFSALAPYKRIDLAVEAFNRLGRPLKIGGTGQEMDKLRGMAGPNIEFLGWVDDADVADLYAGCRAFVFPGLEDFGITPLEAMASGRPVIAFGRGGALETVRPLGDEAPTGVFFEEQTVESLCEAVSLFEANEGRYSPEALRRHALSFDRPEFKRRLAAYLRQVAPEAEIRHS
jgi:glycosyltransferase involved in cell wall biosynthesis